MPFDKPVTLRVDDGTIESAEVTAQEGGEVLQGTVGADGGSWVSTGTPLPSETYNVSAEVADADGANHTLTGTFTVSAVPDSRRLTLVLRRDQDRPVGIGAPLVIRFDQEVTERAAVEQAMHVSSKPQVMGAWHWVNPKEVHFRPEEYWQAGTRIGLHLDFNGVRAGKNLWGGRDYSYEIKVGQAQTAIVDASAHTMTVMRDGQAIGTFEASLGKPDFATRNGIYVVQSKAETYNMTSCSVGIACNKSDPDYYDLDVKWSVRLTNSGTFVHAAPWSETSQGEDNVSHGCINLSEKNGKRYFDMVQYGDVVKVVNSTREANDLVRRGDPGMVDWNMSWSEYVAGSALGKEIKTQPLS